MALADLPTTITASRSRSEHIADHARLHREQQGVVYSANYASVQAAVDDAAAKRRPLVIAPGEYLLTEPLVIRGCDRLHISAYRATLTASADMASLVDVANCTRCTWQGGWLNIPPGRKVDNALYVYYDTAQCTHNLFRDVVIAGDYSVGIRVGKTGSTYQCDHIYFDNVECNGVGLAGQVGIYVGPGVYGNCLNHTFRNIMVTEHATHVVVDRTNAYFDGVFMDEASVADWRVDATTFSARNIRSESAARMLVTGGPSTFATLLSFSDVLWGGDRLAADGEFIRAHLAGVLRLTDIHVRNPAVTPKIYAAPGAPLLVDIRGLASATPVADMLKWGNANPTARAHGALLVSSSTRVESIASYP